MKLLKSLKKPAIYFAIYFGMQIAVTIIVTICLGLYMGLTSDIAADVSSLSANMEEIILNNLFGITLLAALITLIIYHFMLKNKGDSLAKFCGVRKISIKNVTLILIMGTCLALLSSLVVGLLQDFFTDYATISESISSVTETVKNTGGELSGDGSITTRVSIEVIMAWIGMFSMIVGIPVFEEVLFRGLIFNSLKGHLKIGWCVVISAIIFGIAHMNVLQGIYACFLGVVLAIAYEKTKTIWAPIIMHVIYNFFGGYAITIIADNVSLELLYIIFGVAAIILPITLIIFLKNNRVEKVLEIDVQ